MFSATSLAIEGDSLPGGVEKNKEPRRSVLVQHIVARWGDHVNEAYGISPETWASQMRPLFSKLPLSTIQQAANARIFTEMDDIILGRVLVTAAKASPGFICSEDLDLSYVPVTPCRILDTRLVGGKIPDNSSRSFDVSSIADFGVQGGASGDCNGVGSVGSIAAAAITFITVLPSGVGYLSAYPFGAQLPLASVVNYSGGDIRSNSSIVSLAMGSSSKELTIYTAKSTHVVADIVGYFIKPQATALECTEISSGAVTVAAGGSATGSTGICPSSYSISGGGCNSSSFSGRIVSTRTMSDRHFCAWANEGTSDMTGIAYAKCCRTPGR